MQPQRRVSLPAPARTTRMNGGPRLRAGTPLPPYRPSVATQDARGGRTGASDTPASLGVPDTHPDRQTTPDAHATAAGRSAQTGGLTAADARLTMPRAGTTVTYEGEASVADAAAADPAADTATETFGEPQVAGTAASGSTTYDAIAGAPDSATTDDAAGMDTAPGPFSGEPRPYVPPAIVEESPTFPMDAFIIPEGSARLPCGVGEPAVRTVTADEQESPDSEPAPSTADGRVPDLVDTAPLSVRDEQERRPRSASMREQRAHDVADRLEALATQLRDHGYEVLAQKSVRGDALDALLAGVIAGYLVAAE